MLRCITLTAAGLSPLCLTLRRLSWESMMKTIKGRPADAPATVSQLAAAMAALGRYTGANSDAEHKAETARLGSERYYRLLLANALLGCVEGEALDCDSAGASADHLLAAHRQALTSAGANDDPAKLLGFLRWRTLRIEGPLREMAQDASTGPLPLAAAHAAGGLQRLLAVCAAGQDPMNASPEALLVDLRGAREALTDAVVNIDIMLRLLKQAEDLFSR